MLDAAGTDLKLALWSDKNIVPSSRWQAEIEEALSTAAAAVLLLSPAFFASAFIRDYEIPPLLAAACAGELRLFVVVLEACDHQSVTGTFQAVNDPRHPLVSVDEAARRVTWQRLISLLAEVAAQIDAEARIGAEGTRLSHDADAVASVAHINDKIARARVDPAFNENEPMRENTLVFLEGQRCQALASWLIEESKRPDLRPERSKAIVRMLEEVARREEVAMKRATELTQQFADQTLAMLNEAKKR